MQIDNKDLLGRLIDGGTLIVPSSQRAAAVRFAHARAALAAGLRVWDTPDVLPWQAWLGREAARAPQRSERAWHLNPAEEWWLWRAAVSEACEGRGLLQPESLAAPVRNAAGLLEEWGIALASAPTEEAELLLHSRALFAARCRALGAVPLTVAGLGPPMGTAAVTLAGFDAVSPARRSALGARGISSYQPGTASARQVHKWRARDTEDEVLAAALWARSHLERDPAARVLILLPDLDQRRAAMHSALMRTLSPNSLLAGVAEEALFAFEGGTPLVEIPLIRCALDVLRLASGPIEYEDFAALLRSPFLAAGDRQERLQLELWLRERPVATFSGPELALLAAALPAGSGQSLLRRWQQVLGLAGRARESTASWARLFAACLEGCGWPGPAPLGSDAEQARERFMELLGELSDLAPVTGPVTAREAAGILGERALHGGFEPAREDAPVTVSAVLGDPLVHYAGIWAGALSGERWPPAPAPDPFIPTALQRQAGLPRASVAGQRALALQHLARWQDCAAELVLSSPRQDGELELSESPLLADIAAIDQPAGHSQLDPLTAFWQRQPAAVRVPEPATPPWQPVRPLPGGTRALELQSLCPFRAFAEQRLAATALSEPTPGLDARLRGQLLHDALERVWQALLDQSALLALAPAAVDELIGASVAAAGASLEREAAIAPDARLWRQELERSAQLIGQLLDEERGREPFSVAALEQPVSLRLGEAQLRMRLDRLDRFTDGTFAVIDYKSGNVQRFESDAMRPQHPQLLAYALAASEPLAAVASVHVQGRGILWRGAADREGRVPAIAGPKAGQATLAEQRELWRERLMILAQEFLAGEARVQPQPGACRYCHLPLLCRIDELNTGDEGEDRQSAGELGDEH